MTKKQIAIIGAGPSGLAAAEALSGRGYAITVYEAMPTPARKLLWAGKSGLNISHAEPYAVFKTRFGNSQDHISPALDEFTPDQIQQWTAELGIETFIGSSSRIFPKHMKASPLLRAWLARLYATGVELKSRHKWMGFDGGNLQFETDGSSFTAKVDAVVLALGGASYKRLGSTAQWVPWLEEKAVSVVPFRPANCGFDVKWSEHMVQKHAGDPVKTVVGLVNGIAIKGEFVVTSFGIEGSMVYAHSAALRDQLETGDSVTLNLDLSPDRSVDQLEKSLERQNPKQSLSNRLRKGAKLTGVKSALVRELHPEAGKFSPQILAQTIKALHIPLVRTRPIDEAISVAGGIAWNEIDENYMLNKLPGTFVAGEMVDWEAPTGGYLITACLATGRAAGLGVHNWLSNQNEL